MVSPGKTGTSGVVSILTVPCPVPCPDCRITVTVEVRARGVNPPGDRNGLTYIHTADIGIAAGRSHLAEDVERTVVQDLDRYSWIDDVVTIERGGDIGLQLVHGSIGCGNLAQQRHGDVTGTIDLEIARHIILPETHD